MKIDLNSSTKLKMDSKYMRNLADKFNKERKQALLDNPNSKARIIYDLVIKETEGRIKEAAESGQYDVDLIQPFNSQDLTTAVSCLNQKCMGYTLSITEGYKSKPMLGVS